MQQTTSRTHHWFSIWWWFYRLSHVRSDYTLENLKNREKNTRKSADTIAEIASSFFSRPECVRVRIPRMMLFTLAWAFCWASKRKSDKYIIYELAYPRLRDGLCRYSLNLRQTIRVVLEPNATSSTTLFFFIRMLFFRPRLNILIFLPILGRKYSCIILKL